MDHTDFGFDGGGTMKTYSKKKTIVLFALLN